MKSTFTKVGTAMGLMVVTVLQAHAQQPASHLEETIKHRGFAPSLMPVTAAANKGTAIKQRVIATTMYAVNADGSSYSVDSTVYKYSGKSSSAFDLHFLAYREHYPGTHTGGTSRDFTEVAIQADSMTFHRVGATVLFAARTYTTAGKVATSYARPGNELPFSNGMLMINQYNAAGFVTAQQQLGWNTATTSWDTLRLRKLAYTASGWITRDTLYEYIGTNLQPISFISYRHDAQGNLLQEASTERYGTGWRDVYRKNNAYDGQNRMIRSAYEFNLGNGLVATDLDSFEYTGSLKAFTKWTMYTMISGNWVRSQKWEKHLNAQLLADTLRIMSWNPSTNVWDIGSTTAFQYNSYNNPVRSAVYMVNATTPGLINTYYYELFDDAPAAVQGIHKIAAAVYPNPAQEQLDIKIPDAPNKQVSIIITDISGRVMVTQQSEWKQETGQIGIGRLAAGTYLLHINVQGSNYQQTFVKK